MSTSNIQSSRAVEALKGLGSQQLVFVMETGAVMTHNYPKALWNSNGR